jgi:hypothetical protein
MTYRVLTPVNRGDKLDKVDAIITNFVSDWGHDATGIVTDIGEITTNYASTPVTLTPISVIYPIKPVPSASHIGVFMLSYSVPFVTISMTYYVMAPVKCHPMK